MAAQNPDTCSSLKTIKEASVFFNVTPETIRRWIKSGKIPAYTKPSGRVVGIPAEALTIAPASISAGA